MRKLRWLSLLVLVSSALWLGAFTLSSQVLKLELAGDATVFIRQGEPYLDAGVITSDPDDPVVTDNPVDTGRYGHYVVTYTLNKGSRSTVVTRDVIVLDTVPPAVTLHGEEKLQLKAGSGYTEPGYTASDPQDGDLTSKVKIDSSLDLSTPGTYVLTYTVKDKSGYTGSAKRIIEVIPKHWDTLLYLTFDDGPSEETAKILDTLQAYGIKATFFVQRTNDRFDPLILRAAAEGHTIGVHTYTHRYEKIYASKTAYFSDLEKIRSHVESVIGYAPTLVRFPGGSSIGRVSRTFMHSLILELHDRGYEYTDWNIDSGDGKSYDGEKMLSEVLRKLGSDPQYILLFHDGAGHAETAEALPKILDALIAEGYRFAPIGPETVPVHHRS